MSTNYRNQATVDEAHRWADRFLDHQTAIIARNLVSVAPSDDDYNRATDLIMNYARISLRVRKNSDLKYKREFTVRAKNRGDATEAEKLKHGVDFLLYGFSNKAEDALEFWVLADMNAITTRLDNAPKTFVDNNDGTGFWILNWRDFKETIITHGGNDQ